MKKIPSAEVATIQRSLTNAMRALDACGQDDLSEQVKAIFKEVAERWDA